MYPKIKKKKKRKSHPPSILHSKSEGTCYLCMKDGDYSKKRGLEEHHIYIGPRRAISEEHGFKVYLCKYHHTSSVAAVHNNQDNLRLLQRECQEEWELTHSRKEWMELMGRNYIN